MDRKASQVVPIHLTPVEASGYAPALSFYKDDGVLSISVSGSSITVEGQDFTIDGVKSLSLLAAEIKRALPNIDVHPLADVAPTSGSIFKAAGDVTPDGGTVLRYLGMSLRVLERTRIRLVKPHPDAPSAAWWGRINRGTLRTTYAGITYTFGVPEYWNQSWSPKYGAPYKEYGGVECTVVDDHKLKLPRIPVLWPGPLTLYRNGKAMQSVVVEDVSSHNGLVYLNSPVGLNDRIHADFVYKEENYVYKGINLNPTLQHSPYLVDRFTVFYLVPHQSNAGLRNSTCVRHIVGDTLGGAISELAKGVNSQIPIVLLGAIRTRQVEDAIDVSVYDARRPGGGVKDTINATSVESEAWFYSDIGNYDGRPYPGNAVVIVKLPENVKTLFSEDEIYQKTKRHLALRVLPIVDYE